MNPLSNNDAGIYMIKVSLSDNRAAPNYYTFRLTVESVSEPQIASTIESNKEIGQTIIPKRSDRARSTKKPGKNILSSGKVSI